MYGTATGLIRIKAANDEQLTVSYAITRHPPMRITLRRMLVAAAAGACAVLAQPAYAQREAHDFHGRDFHGFTPHERNIWVGGHWQQGWHDNRFAWWWVSLARQHVRFL